VRTSNLTTYSYVLHNLPRSWNLRYFTLHCSSSFFPPRNFSLPPPSSPHVPNSLSPHNHCFICISNSFLLLPLLFLIGRFYIGSFSLSHCTSSYLPLAIDSCTSLILFIAQYIYCYRLLLLALIPPDILVCLSSPITILLHLLVSSSYFLLFVTYGYVFFRYLTSVISLLSFCNVYFASFRALASYTFSFFCSSSIYLSRFSLLFKSFASL
jgi:hypothetical protein